MAEMTLDEADRHVRHFVEKGASKEEIGAFLEEQGVSARDLVGHRKGFGERAVDAVTGAVDSVKDMYYGKHDPRFENLPEFGANPTLGPSEMMAAKTLGMTDAQYGDIIKKSLEEKGQLRGSQIDENGYEIITYVDEGGQEKQAYINKPGMNGQDIDRAITSAVPFIATGLGAGIALKGGPLLMRMMGQFLAGAGTSIGVDAAASAKGSEQGIDAGRALVIGAGGAVFEGLSPAIALAWRKLFKNKKYFDPTTAKMTPEGKKAAKKMGLDGDAMEERIGRSMNDILDDVKSKDEFGASQRTSEFGIESTKGQRTNNPMLLAEEQHMRKGNRGPDARVAMDIFDEKQKGQLTAAAREKVIPDPNRTVDLGASGRGEALETGIDTVKAAYKAEEKRLWNEVGPLKPSEMALSELPDRIRDGMKGFITDERQSPTAFKMLGLLEDYVSGKPVTRKMPLVGDVMDVPTIDSVRRNIGRMMKGADTPEDQAATKIIYRAYNEWIEDISERALVEGNVDAAAKLKTAIAFSRDFRNTMMPRGRDGRLTAGGQRMKNAFEKADSPEGLMDEILGKAGPTSSAPKGVVEALRKIKAMTSSLKGADQEMVRAWDSIRLSYWLKLVQKNTGKPQTPRMMIKNIESAFKKQQSVIKVLFNEEERKTIMRFKAAIKDIDWNDPFPSQTPYGTEYNQIRRGQKGILGVGRTTARAKQRSNFLSREDFSFAWARMWEKMRDHISVLAGHRADKMALNRAKKSTSQELTLKKPPSFGAVGSQLSLQQERMESE